MRWKMIDIVIECTGYYKSRFKTFEILLKRELKKVWFLFP
jgi:hypothetical protein